MPDKITIPKADETPVLPVWPDVAKALNISRASAYQGVKAGEIPSIRIGSRILVPTAWLRKVLMLDEQPGGAHSVPGSDG